jgi:beta-phosphoglucomutase-like phosphatase (HAD superfamily)
MIAGIFDMDGTLVDSEELAFSAAEEGLEEYYARDGRPRLIPTPCPRRSQAWQVSAR